MSRVLKWTAGLAIAALAVGALAVRAVTVEDRTDARMAIQDRSPTLRPPSTGAGSPSQPPAPAGREPPAPRPPIPRHQRAPAVYSPDPTDDRAVVGLGYRSLTDAERTRLAVPERFGRGVVITSIHPDAPAVLSGLAVDDVILRAHRTDVHSEADLEAATGQRLQTVLTVARGGQLFQVVLHRPYQPSTSAQGDADPPH